MSTYLDNFKKVIRECSYSNTYKMSWAKGIVELSNDYLHFDDDLISIPLAKISEKMFKYYWDQTIYFNLFQSAPNQPPIILQNVTKLIKLYQEKFKHSPVVFIRASPLIISNFKEEYEKAIRESIRNIKENVMPFFLNLGNTSYDFYEIEKEKDAIKIKKDHLEELDKNQQDLFDLINYRWSLMLENYNSCPRIAKKVRIIDEQEVKRNVRLTVFDEFLDFENKEHICFVCGKEITKEELSRDHVIPWSYMYSDDLWNLVYVHKRCNSIKSNITPSLEEINKLKDRNLKLKRIIDEKSINEGLKKRSILESFDYAIANDYVEKFYFGCKGC
jgi:5-methylcytosine-specific restriction endonuclease McrA